MDFRQLNALLAVADTGSFSAAARSLHTVQSNVSTHVARLERLFGVDEATDVLGEMGDGGELHGAPKHLPALRTLQVPALAT